uniref:Uncharacterized protein n=1 Tax=Arcella intermedia TaxID=1963864 RepID=A0A6B2LXQ4_9EUKA
MFTSTPDHVTLQIRTKPPVLSVFQSMRMENVSSCYLVCTPSMQCVLTSGCLKRILVPFVNLL